MKNRWKNLALILLSGIVLGMIGGLLSLAHAEETPTVTLPRLSLLRFGASVGVDSRWQTKAGLQEQEWLARLGVSYKLGTRLAAVGTLRQPFKAEGQPEWTAGLSLVIVRDGKVF